MDPVTISILVTLCITCVTVVGKVLVKWFKNLKKSSCCNFEMQSKSS